MKISNNFYIQEFVSRDFYNEHSDGSLKFIDQRIVLACQYIREKIAKPITINNWSDGGEREFSGLRPFVCKVGVAYSQHKFGRAADLKCDRMSSEEMRQLVKRYWPDLKKYISTIEDDTDGWLHIDCRWTENPEILNIVPNPFKASDRSLESAEVGSRGLGEIDEYDGWD